MSDTRTMTNPQVADLLGIHFTHASRLRTGQREPSITMIAKVRDVLDWSADDQLDAILKDRYHILLEGRLAKYTKENADV